MCSSREGAERSTTATMDEQHRHPTCEAGGGPLSWAILDTHGYIADRRNASTAYGRTSTGGKVQVTFSTAPPPAISYLCLWYPEKAAGVADQMPEPRIIAAEADLVVLRVGLSCLSCGPQNEDVFVYQAGGRGKWPSLHQVRHPGIQLFFNVGLLHHRRSDDDSNDSFYIFGFNSSWNCKRPWEFTLDLYDPKTEAWSSTDFCLARQHRHSQFRHSASKVIMLGEGDLMGFVDLMRGILVCDVLSCTGLYHIPFPKPLKVKQPRDVDPMIFKTFQ